MAEEDYDDDREARIFTSGGSLNLNSTFLTAAGEPHLVTGHSIPLWATRGSKPEILISAI